MNLMENQEILQQQQEQMMAENAEAGNTSQGKGAAPLKPKKENSNVSS